MKNLDNTLNIINKYHDANLEGLHDQLSKEGFSIVESGCFADVLINEKENFVIKIFSADKAYLSYVNAIKNRNNIYFPKIYKIIEKIINKIKYYIVFIEKLLSISEMNNDVLIDTLYHHLNFKDTPDDLYHYFNVNYIPINKELSRAWCLILNILFRSRGKFRRDMHEYNIMYRKTRKGFIPVLTDPLAS